MAGAPRRRYFSKEEYVNKIGATNMPVNRTKQYQQRRWARRPWWQQVSIHTCSASASILSSTTMPSSTSSSSSPFVSKLSILMRSLSIPKRRLRFEPDNKLYFPYEPGNQSTSAIRIENISGDPVAFKFQTTAPKSCFMRPPSGVLAAGESIIAIVVKFLELAKSPSMVSRANQHAILRKTSDKFKIVTLKVEDGVEYSPELVVSNLLLCASLLVVVLFFHCTGSKRRSLRNLCLQFDEQKELVRVEQILQVVLLDPNRPSPQLCNLKGLLEECDAQAAKRKIEEKTASLMSNISDVNVLEEWKQQKLARKEMKGVLAC